MMVHADTRWSNVHAARRSVMHYSCVVGSVMHYSMVVGSVMHSMVMMVSVLHAVSVVSHFVLMCF